MRDGGNVGIGTTTFGTSAAKVLAIGSGTAPTTSPANAVQLWSADLAGGAGTAALHLRTEDDVEHVFGSKVGIGTTDPNELLDVDGDALFDNVIVESTVKITEQAAANADVATIGQVWVKDDVPNQAYFTDDAGTDHPLVATYGEMFFYESAGTETVGETSQYYGVQGQFAGDDLAGWTFVAGSSGVGTITTDEGTRININDVTHGLISGDYINVQSSNHAGTAEVNYVDANNFDILIAYVGDEACTWQEGDHLLAGAGSAGKYLISVSVTASAGAAAKEYKFEGVQNATHIDQTAFDITTSGTKHQSGASFSLITIAEADRIWLQFKNQTDTQDLEYQHANVNLVRL